MKKLNILILSALTAVSGSALAMGGSIEQGKNFTNHNLEIGKSSKGDNGVAFPIGGGVNVALTDSIHVFGEGYVAPDGLNNSVKNYVEANGGVSWTPVKPVTLKVGYRHVSVDGKDGRPNHTLIDGAYVGGGVSF